MAFPQQIANWLICMVI